jgi:hypothetical protein
LVATGCGSGCSAEHDGLGPTCPSDKQGRFQRVLRSAMENDLGVRRRNVLGSVCSSGQWKRGRRVNGQPRPGSACSFGQDGPRSPTPFAVFEITDDRWVSGGLSPSGFELFGSGSDRPFGMTILCGRTFERLRSRRKAVIDWRSNGRRVTGTERCTAPREGKAL